LLLTDERVNADVDARIAERDEALIALEKAKAEQ